MLAGRPGFAPSTQGNFEFCLKSKSKGRGPGVGLILVPLCLDTKVLIEFHRE
jgi:hypothetical protein